MSNNKGIKLYRSKGKKYRRKSKLRSVISAIVTVVLIGCVAFLGYSVGAPILNYLQNKDSYYSESGKYVPDVTEDLVSSESGLLSDNGAVSDVVSSNSNTEALEHSDAYTLNAEALKSITDLEAALTGVSKDYNSVIVPLKLQGGYLNYASVLEDAETADAVNSDVDLQDVYDTITDKGFIPIAQISTLNDNIYPKMYGDTAYRFENEDTLWLDNSPSNGGKPWISPFSAGTKSYLSRIVKEISKTGFKEIVCTDIEFPAFRSSDLNYIGSTVKSETRYLALVETANQMIDAANINGSNIIIEESAVKILNSTSEIYKPDELGKCEFSVAINLEEAGDSISLVSGSNIELSGKSADEKIKLIAEGLKHSYSDKDFIVTLTASEYTESELTKAKTMLADLGYEAVYVK